MEFIYKEDWPQAQERLLAWWQGEIIDRVAIKVHAPKKERKSVPPPADLKTRWTDPDYLIAAHEAAIESTFYGGECIPSVTVNLGPTTMSAFVGCPLHHDERTGWQTPIVHDHSDWDKIEFEPDNYWWKLTKQLTEIFAERGQGRYFVGISDIGDASDAMAYLRSPDNLCMDLIEIPDTIYRVRDKLVDLWFYIYEELYSIIQRKLVGSTSWLQVWSPGKSYTLQSDFSCMISAPMYREFVLPEIEAQVKYLDHTIYHLDGPDAIQHLDMLLEIPDLGGIQWVPGAGAPPEKDWSDLLRRIQAAGKLINIGVAAQDIEALLEVISPKGLMINTSCASEEEARDLLKKAETWTARAMRK